MSDELEAIRKANEERMARLRALEQAEKEANGTAVRAAPAGSSASVASSAPAASAASSAPVPAVVKAVVPARMGALPARMGTLPARMAAVKPLVPAAAVPAPAAMATPVTARVVQPPPPAASSSSSSSASSPPSPAVPRSTFGIRSNTFNASDLFGSSSSEEEALPPPKGYSGPSGGALKAVSPGGRSEVNSGFSEESLGASQCGSPLKASSPGRGSVGSSIDLSELRRRAEELDRQTQERAAQRAAEAERKRAAQDEERRIAEHERREAEVAERAQEEAMARKNREEEERARAREATEMMRQATGVHATATSGAPVGGPERGRPSAPLLGMGIAPPTREAPRLNATVGRASGAAPPATVSQSADVGTQTEDAGPGRGGASPALDGMPTSSWGGPPLYGGQWSGMLPHGMAPIYVPVPVPISWPMVMGGMNPYGAPLHVSAPWPVHGATQSLPQGGLYPGYAPPAASAGVPTAGPPGPHIPMAKVIGVLPPAGTPAKAVKTNAGAPAAAEPDVPE